MAVCASGFIDWLAVSVNPDQAQYHRGLKL